MVQDYDLIIVGSGGGAMVAALTAKAHGLTSVIFEKQTRYGGSTAYSGGVLWIPNNRFLTKDSTDHALLYLDSLLGAPVDNVERARRLEFVCRGSEMLDFLEGQGMQFMHAHWPDYYSDSPGGLAEGRSLVSPMFDIRALGGWTEKLARFEGWPDIPVGSQEFATASLLKRTWRGRLLALRVAGRLLDRRLTGKHLRASGNALQGRMLQVGLRERIPIRLSCAVTQLVTDRHRVSGVVVTDGGQSTMVRARRGVLLVSGGFSRNPAMRDSYLPKPLDSNWSLANPGDTGEMLQAVIDMGAATDLMSEAWWCPSSRMPNGEFGSFHMPTDTAKPHLIVVDKQGNRIGNEANSYMEFGQRMFAHGAVPAWAVFDSRHRSRYSWGMAPAGAFPEDWLASGYIQRADSLEELATRCHIDPTQLRATVTRFNGFAVKGVDEDFGRGASAYNRYNGDPRHRPNPNLGELVKPPFYGCALYPGDVGTAGGVRTDACARVIRSDGQPIDGLYAAGNCAASVMGRYYPGAGASIGSSFVFGYVAALHASRLGEERPK